jgi:hypothetical protein
MGARSHSIGYLKMNDWIRTKIRFVSNYDSLFSAAIRVFYPKAGNCQRLRNLTKEGYDVKGVD